MPSGAILVQVWETKETKVALSCLTSSLGCSHSGLCEGPVFLLCLLLKATKESLLTNFSSTTLEAVQINDLKMPHVFHVDCVRLSIVGVFPKWGAYMLMYQK